MVSVVSAAENEAYQAERAAEEAERLGRNDGRR